MARARWAAPAVPAASAAARDPGGTGGSKRSWKLWAERRLWGVAWSPPKSPSSPTLPCKSALEAGLAGRTGVAGRGCTPLPVRRSRVTRARTPQNPDNPGTAGPVAVTPPTAGPRRTGLVAHWLIRGTPCQLCHPPACPPAHYSRDDPALILRLGPGDPGTSSEERCRKHPVSGPGAAQASQNLPAQ
jgi:hypothetical protein